MLIKLLITLIVLNAVLLLTGCAPQSGGGNAEVSNAPAVPSVNDPDASGGSEKLFEFYKVDEAELERLRLQNRMFEQVPEEFTDVDFRNFRYPLAELKDGKHEKVSSSKSDPERQTFNFNNVYFIDLNGDDQKEAIVFLSAVNCRASCDGGRDIVYFYSTKNNKPRLLGTIANGSKAFGCSLKSFTVKDKKIYVKRFNVCKDDLNEEKSNKSSGKFAVKDETHIVYSVSRSDVKKQLTEEVETPPLNIMNSPTLISLSE